MALRLRALTSEERMEVERLAQSRTAEARLVERARIVWFAQQGDRMPVVAAKVRLSEKTVRKWLKRFNDDGLAGLQDKPRDGRPAIYGPDEVATVIALSLTSPQALGLPFACWTLDRLQAYLNEEKGIAIKRSRIGELLLAEGLKWRRQETWFGERVDPDFAEKRGASSSSTSTHPQPAW